MNNYVCEYTNETTKYSGPLAIVTYEGALNEDKEMEDANCFIQFANGATYRGGIACDKLQGRGRMTDPNTSSVYDGDWNEDRREGMATFTCGGETFTGNYLNNKRHGAGKEVDAAGNELTGVWVQGDVVSGKVEFADGGIYSGALNSLNERHGKGRYISPDGDVQDGFWIEDDFQGPV